MDQQPNSSPNLRRPSGNNFARFAFNIYGGGGSNSSNNVSSVSQPASFSSYSSQRNNSNNSNNSNGNQNYSISGGDVVENKLKFASNNEILCVSLSNYDNNVVAIGGQRLLQVLRINSLTNEINIEKDLNPSLALSRSSKIGYISDLKFGHHQLNNYIAAATSSGNICLYNLIKSDRILTTLNDHSRTVNTIDFNPNQQSQYASWSLISGSQDGTIKIWDLRTNSNRAAVTITGTADPVRCVQFSPHNSTSIAGIFDSGVIKKYDLRNPNQIDRKLNAHTGPGLTLQWHPELDYIASGGRDKQLQVWNMAPSNNEQRTPDFVINTAGAISKVSWSPIFTSGNIFNSQIATCFYNDDPCIQVWSLNRKYIPSYNIESHSNLVTGICWKDNNTILSGSKDKTLVQHDLTKIARRLDNLHTVSMDFSYHDLVFVNQNSSDYEKSWMNTQDAETTRSPPIHQTFSSDANLVSSSAQALASLNINSTPSSFLSSSSGQHPYNSTSPNMNAQERPSLLRNATHRPVIKRNLSNRQNTLVNQFLHSSPFLCPVEIPTSDNDAIFEFLSSHYLISIPDGMNLISVCQYNSSVAATGGHYRDSQTWKIISSSIEFAENSGDIQYGSAIGETRAGQMKEEHEGENKDTLKNFDSTRSNSEIDVGSLGSHSTNYFGGASLPRDNFASQANLIMSRSLSVEEYKREPVSKLTKASMNSETNENAIVDDEDDESVKDINSGTKQSKNHHTDSNGNHTVVPNDTKKLGATEKNHEVNNIHSSQKPIAINLKAKRSSFNHYPHEKISSSLSGSVQALSDDDANAYNSSLGKSPLSLVSTVSSSNRPNFGGIATNGNNNSSNTWKDITKNGLTTLPERVRLNSRVSSKSARSTLTKILKEDQSKLNRKDGDMNNGEADGEEAEDFDDGYPIVPWSPHVLISKAAKYGAHQGDIIMCATLALLFANHYQSRSISKYEAMDWIYSYHEILLRKGLFATAADVVKTSSVYYPIMKQKGQMETSIRTYCNNCYELIINESSKNKLKMGQDVDFGYWYCDKCKKILGRCCYCNELVKGMSVSLLECGHLAHFGCYKTWFLVERETCCPCCGYVVI